MACLTVSLMPVRVVTRYLLSSSRLAQAHSYEGGCQVPKSSKKRAIPNAQALFPLAKASHMAKARVHVGEDHSQCGNWEENYDGHFCKESVYLRSIGESGPGN